MVLNNIVDILVPPRFKKRDDETQEAAETTTTNDSVAPQPPTRRKRCCGFTGTQFLLSGASDANIGADWVFYESMKKNPNVPGVLVSVEWLLVVVATIIWAMQVTEGRLFKRLARRCFGVELTKKKIIDAGVWLEDFPQLGISLLVQFVYANGFSLPVFFNLLTSGFSAYHKTKALLHDDIEEEEDFDATPEERQPILDV